MKISTDRRGKWDRTSWKNPRKMKDGTEKVNKCGRVIVRKDDHHSGKIDIQKSWLVIEKYFRIPKKGEQVHHVDGNPTNNNINNLILFDCFGSHMKFHRGEQGLFEEGILFDGRLISEDII